MNTMLENFTTPVAEYFDKGYVCGYLDAKNNAESMLTKQELDILVEALKHRINELVMYKELHKFDAMFWYDRCDKSDPSTAHAYKHYKQSKLAFKITKKQCNSLAKLQSKLKKLRSA